MADKTEKVNNFSQKSLDSQAIFWCVGERSQGQVPRVWRMREKMQGEGPGGASPFRWAGAGTKRSRGGAVSGGETHTALITHGVSRSRQEYSCRERGGRPWGPFCLIRVRFTRSCVMRFARFSLVGLAFLMWRCGAEPVPADAPKEAPPEEPVSDLGGALPEVAPRVVALPFAAGKAAHCVQGVNDSFSHRGKATRYDLDFDTSNSEDEAVFAPAGGRAWVHRDEAPSGFGVHVNVDLFDGTYLVLAHLKEVFVENYADVAPGQFLGYEGCTGRCTGDHVHVGRHYGLPELQAEYGESVPLWYVVGDPAAPDGERALAGSEFVCDLGTGVRYVSTLAVARSHPNGTLVYAPGDPRVYRLDDGRLRWFETQDVFWSHRYDFKDIVPISPEELSCTLAGDPIRGLGMVEAAHDEDGMLWLMVGSRERFDRYRIRVRTFAWERVLASWGLSYDRAHPPPRRGSSDDLLRSWPVRDGYAVFRDGTVLEEESTFRAFVVSDGVAMPFRDRDTYLLLGLSKQELVAPDGAITAVQGRVGDCSFDTSCIGEEDVKNCGGFSDVSSSSPATPPTNFDDRYPPGILWVQDPAEAEGEPRLLAVEWRTPFGLVANRITLSGEYRFANGSFGFWWRDIMTKTDTDTVGVVLGGASSGDTFRFSVEYETEGGRVSWSCIGPYPPGRQEGRVTADVDGTPVQVENADDPASDGCGLVLTVP